jgi:hypothetical protein
LSNVVDVACQGSGGDPLVGGRGLVVPHPVLELHAGEHVDDELMAVEPPSPLLGGMQQLVGHRERGLLGSGAVRDAGAELDRSEAALDRVGGPQVPPGLAREVVERGQRRPVAVEIGNRLRVLGVEL